MVYGNYQDYYEGDTATGIEQIAYDSGNFYLAKRDPEDGLPYDYFDTAYFGSEFDFLSDRGTVTLDDGNTERYNLVKYASDGKLRFVRKALDPTALQFEYVFYMLDADDTTQSIKFYDQSDSGWESVDVQNTIVADVDPVSSKDK